jgi:hypothetical protein
MTFLTFTLASSPGSVEPMLVPDPTNNQMLHLDVAVANLGAPFVDLVPYSDALKLLSYTTTEFEYLISTMGSSPLFINGQKFIGRNTLSILSRYKRERTR